jgi:hypothetical protein
VPAENACLRSHDEEGDGEKNGLGVIVLVRNLAVGDLSIVLSIVGAGLVAWLAQPNNKESEKKVIPIPRKTLRNLADDLIISPSQDGFACVIREPGNAYRSFNTCPG